MVVRTDIDEELPGVGVGQLLDDRERGCRRRHLHACRHRHFAFKRLLVVPVHVIERVDMETEIERAVAGSEELLIDVGAELRIKGIVGLVEHRLDPQRRHAAR